MNSNQSTRRQMLGLGVASLGALTLTNIAQAQDTAVAAPDTTTAPTPPSASDADLLRAALLVEQVGAAYYSQVLGAQNARTYLPEKIVAAVTQMAQTKNAHITAIAGALSDTGAAPAFKFPQPTFVSRIAMPWLGYTLEEIAIGAHLNALDTLSSRALRPVVVGIIGANSANAALQRSLIGETFSPRYFEAKFTPSQVEAYISTYRA